MRHYICKECGTKFSCTTEEIPTSPPWEDGHVCVMTRLPNSPPKPGIDAGGE